MEKWVPITNDLQKNIWLAIVWTQKLWNGGEGYLSFTEKGKERIYTEKKWLMWKKILWDGVLTFPVRGAA